VRFTIKKSGFLGIIEEDSLKEAKGLGELGGM